MPVDNAVFVCCR